MEFIVLALCSVILCNAGQVNSDKPCAARHIEGQSVICVCNATYCDEVTRDHVVGGKFNTYTSSAGGLRFHKRTEDLIIDWTYDSPCSTVLSLDTSLTYQDIQGFGGAVTDAVAINWKSLTSGAQDNFIRSYFSNVGLEYNMLRVPIGACDFSTHAYTYNETPIDDPSLSNYTLLPEDTDLKIPLIQAGMKVATHNISIVGSVWTAPGWMKTSDGYYGHSYLLPQYMQSFADYILKFVDLYWTEAQIPIWAVTTTNEPIVGDGILPFGNIDLGWSVKSLTSFITQNLGPAVANSSYSNLKILTGDDQRFTIPIWFNMVVSTNPEVLNYISGVAVHFYYDDIVAPESMTSALKDFPGVFLLYTEASQGVQVKPTVFLGSWERAKVYIKDIIQNLNFNVIGWIDWNMCLDTTGGPNFLNNFIDSAVIVDANAGEFWKQPMFYAIGHFSKFIPPGSKRIGMKEVANVGGVDHAAFLTPENVVVVVLYNDSNSTTTVRLELYESKAIVYMEPNSVTTVEILNRIDLWRDYACSVDIELNGEDDILTQR